LAIRDNIINTGENTNNRQVFTSSGTFTVPPNIHRVKVTVIGAGGNGGNGVDGEGSGGGGGAGGYVVDYVAVTAGGTASVTVGVNSGTRTSSFAGGTTISASGGSNGTNAPGSLQGLSAIASEFGISHYSLGLQRLTNVVSVAGSTLVLSSPQTSGTNGVVYAHGYGVSGSVRSSTGANNAKHNPLGFGAGGGGGLSTIPTGGLGSNGLVIVEW
jgi:hypothetical protein